MEEIAVFEQELFGNPMSEFLICIGILLLGSLLTLLGATLRTQLKPFM
ncbi:MAG: hypothetical protein V4651_04675 [Bacteroidota bacterium]